MRSVPLSASVLVACTFFLLCFFFNVTAPTEIYTLSLHDALPISSRSGRPGRGQGGIGWRTGDARRRGRGSRFVNISDLFIRRPVMTTLVMLGILIFGAMAYLQLPVSDLPNVDFPTIQVTATLPGASPETMAAAVATPLERQFTTIAGLDSMTS